MLQLCVAGQEISATEVEVAKEEWLSVDQIAPYFSRLSVLYRSGRLALEQVNPDTTRGGRLCRRGRRDHHKA